jgi:hypothetical protein
VHEACVCERRRRALAAAGPAAGQRRLLEGHLVRRVREGGQEARVRRALREAARRVSASARARAPPGGGSQAAGRTAGGRASVRRPNTKQSTAAASASGSETRACRKRAKPRLDRYALPSAPRPAPIRAAAARQLPSLRRTGQKRGSRRGGGAQRLCSAGGARLIGPPDAHPRHNAGPSTSRARSCSAVRAPDAPHPLPKLPAAPGVAR